MNGQTLLNVAIVVLVAGGLWFWLSTSEADVFVDPLSFEHERVALSVMEQIEQGRAFSSDFEAEFGGRTVGAEPTRFARIGQHLIATLQTIERGVQQRIGQLTQWTVHPFRFSVLAADEPNAFALPDGSIYITQGMLRLLNTDDQIAAVLSHEIGHVVLRHSAEAFESQVKGDLLLWVLGQTLGDGLASDLAGGANWFYQLGYSRDQELEADLFGHVLNCAGGFDSEALVDVFNVLGSLDGSILPEFLRTHPKADRRIEAAQDLECRFPISALAG